MVVSNKAIFLLEIVTSTDTVYRWEEVMKKLALPITIFIVGLFVANQFFGIDIERLAEGLFDMLGDILKGSDN